jgi:hypothetical protein
LPDIVLIPADVFRDAPLPVKNEGAGHDVIQEKAGQGPPASTISAVDVDPVTLAIIGGPRRLTTTGDTNEGISVSRDGRRIVIGAANRNERVSLYTLDSSGRRILPGEVCLTRSSLPLRQTSGEMAGSCCS